LTLDNNNGTLHEADRYMYSCDNICLNSSHNGEYFRQKL